MAQNGTCILFQGIDKFNMLHDTASTFDLNHKLQIRKINFIYKYQYDTTPIRSILSLARYTNWSLKTWANFTTVLKSFPGSNKYKNITSLAATSGY